MSEARRPATKREQTNANASKRTRAMQCMKDASTVAHMVLGAPILLTRRGVVNFSHAFPAIPDVKRRKCTAAGDRSKDACMLPPRGAEFFSVVVDCAGASTCSRRAARSAFTASSLSSPRSHAFFRETVRAG